MNKNVSYNHLYVDRPLSGKVARQGRASTLRLLSAHDSDFAETAMRAFLMLCLLASLALCALRLDIGGNQAGANDGGLAPAWTKVVPQAPELPAVKFVPVVR